MYLPLKVTISPQWAMIVLFPLVVACKGNCHTQASDLNHFLLVYIYIYPGGGYLMGLRQNQTTSPRQRTDRGDSTGARADRFRTSIRITIDLSLIELLVTTMMKSSKYYSVVTTYC